MIMHEDIIAEITVGPITKNNREMTQSGINLLESELAEYTAKIKTMKDIIEQGKKFGFLIIVVGLA